MNIRAQYDLFRLLAAGKLVWIETSDDLIHAITRVIALNDVVPAEYRIFDSETTKFVANFNAPA